MTDRPTAAPPVARAGVTADALFIALAEMLDEPLATTDSSLAAEAAKHSGVTVIEL